MKLLFASVTKQVVELVPQAVLQILFFEAIIQIPYDTQVKQVLANGKRWFKRWYGLILPEGFE
jgi:apocytochrome f